MKKLLGLGDVKIIMDNSIIKGNYIPLIETKQVLGLVADATYVLYSIYRTFPFKESTDLEDENMGNLLGWRTRKVQDHRLILERNNLFRTIRYGSKTDGVTKVFVGMDVIALFDAGLPCEILDNKAFNKLKREFGITSPIELVQQAHNIVLEYVNNPDKYK